MNKVRATILFWTVALLSILPFIILCFFSHPGREDYFLDIIFSKYNFSDAQKALYAGLNGRFFANAIEYVCIRLHFVHNFYFLLPLLLFVFTGAAAFFLLNNINGSLLQNSLSLNQVLQASFIFLLLNIYLLADIASNFYWFSAAIVYQVPVILLLLLLGLLIKRFTAAAKRKTVPDIFILFLIILLQGCNETIAVASVIILLLAAVLSIKLQVPGRKIIILYFIAGLVTSLLVVYSSGILHRQKTMQNNTQYITVLPIIAFKTFMVLYNIFKEPLFWVASFSCIVAGSFFSPDGTVKRMLLFFKSPGRIFYSVFVLIAIVVLILSPVLLLTKGAFPDRALNNIIIIAAICLFILAFIAGYSIFPGKFINLTEKTNSFYGIIFTAAAMLFSVTYTDAWKSVFSGYFYHAILIERDRQFQQAKIDKQKMVTIQPYNVVLRQKIKDAFPRGGFKTVTALLYQPPVTIPFFNEAEDKREPGYRKYYGVDSIIIQPDKP